MFNVLIVDDEPGIREGMKSIIPWEEYGFRVIDTASDGKEALSKYQKLPINLMVVDIRMPGMDGLELVETLRSKGDDLPVIIVSGHAEFEYARKAMFYGVKDYILKPIDEEELIAFLKQLKTRLENQAAGSDGHDFFKNVKNSYEILPKNQAADESRSHLNMTEVADQLFYALDTGNKEVVENLVSEWGMEMVENGCSEQTVKTNFVNLVSFSLTKLTSAYPEMESEIQRYTARITDFYNHPEYEMLLDEINALLYKVMDRLDIKQPDHRLKKMVAIIQRDYSRNLKLDKLAEVFHYNSAYLGKLFKDYTGEPFNTYLDKVRIEQAKALLLQKLKVYEVAERVGYHNVDYFHSKFKKYVGMSPSVYKKRNS